MANNYDDRQLRLDEELLRLTFCGIIIATFFASLAAKNLKPLVASGPAAAAATVLGLSAIFAFAYVLAVASALKYQGKRYVDRFPLSTKSTRFFYDASINIFGIFFLALAVEWTDTQYLHLPHTPFVWPIYLVLFSAIYVIARLVWAVALVGIEAFYDYTNNKEERRDRVARSNHE